MDKKEYFNERFSLADLIEIDSFLEKNPDLFSRGAEEIASEIERVLGILIWPEAKTNQMRAAVRTQIRALFIEQMFKDLRNNNLG